MQDAILVQICLKNFESCDITCPKMPFVWYTQDLQLEKNITSKTFVKQ